MKKEKLEYRIALLQGRGKENSAIVNKLKRKLRALSK